MISLALAAGYATRMYPLTENFPKPLLPVGGIMILDRLLMDLDALPEIERHVVVSNHKFIDHFEDWRKRTPLKKPITLIDDGTTSNDNRLGAVRDIQLTIERECIDDDILVLAADNLLDFSLSVLVRAYDQSGASQIFCYREDDLSVLRRCGVATLSADFRVIHMVEKPSEPQSHWAVPPFYLYARRDLALIADAISGGVNVDAPGSLVSWLCERTEIRATEMPGKRIDVGTLEAYERLKRDTLL